jgi:predicted O-methyltransferase YrrM
MKLGAWAYQRAVHLYNKDWFIRRRNVSKDQIGLRESLLNQFRRIDREINCLHMEKEMLVMVDFLLSDAPQGCIVECGSFLGGSSAKLSLVAAETGRKLFVCDSFQGLPTPTGEDGNFVEARSGKARKFVANEYAARRPVVEENVRRLGKFEVCSFVEGFFSDSLPKLVEETKLQPAFIFADADLVASTRDILRNLWPHLASGGRFYTHDANLAELCEGIMDGAFWRDEIGEFPPVLFGAGYGLGFQAGSVAYCRKPAA